MNLLDYDGKTSVYSTAENPLLTLETKGKTGYV